jgi:hypothetical protein
MCSVYRDQEVVGMSERRREMDYITILKEAWNTTWRYKALWVLGLFTAGSATVSSVNWQTDSQDFRTTGHGDWEGFGQFESDMREVGLEIERFFETTDVAEWLPWLLLGIGVLVLIGLAFWVIGIAAKGGLVAQTREALAEREVSARAGWRMGFRRWGRVFLVGLILALPLILAGGVIAGMVAAAVAMLAAAGGEALPGVLGLGLFAPIGGLLFVVLSVAIGMLREVAYRHAVLEDLPALDAVRASWEDLKGRRGVATMWLVMLVVGIGAAIAAGIVMVPVLIITAVVTGAFYMGAGLPGLWVLVPLLLLAIAVGWLLKGVYAAFSNTAWTGFFERMISPDEGASTESAPVASTGDTEV